MSKINYFFLLVSCFLSHTMLWGETNSSTQTEVSQLRLEAIVEIVNNEEQLWSKKEETAIIVGQPVTYQLKSDHIISHISITLYPYKNSENCFVIAQAEVGTLDENNNFLQYYQCAKQLKIQKGKRLRFYPFSASSNSTSDLNFIRLTLTLL